MPASVFMPPKFQSTLPRGSDHRYRHYQQQELEISIHAPSRERHYFGLPTGVDNLISIHAPSRERRLRRARLNGPFLNFNPRSLAGATSGVIVKFFSESHFNPRSLAGATNTVKHTTNIVRISIHAPSRERRIDVNVIPQTSDFNPRSLAGATYI